MSSTEYATSDMKEVLRNKKVDQMFALQKKICTNMFFWCANLGLFEITEWEPCMWLLNTNILAGNAVRQWRFW